MAGKEYYENFWKGMKTQTRLMRISVPHCADKIFYTFDNSENRISIFHPIEGEFSLSKSEFILIDKKVKKLLEVDSSYDQFLLLTAREICGFSIVKNYFDWLAKEKL